MKAMNEKFKASITYKCEKSYVTTKHKLQKILQGILCTESETQYNHKRTGSTKLKEKKKQESRE
jgi:hypothetical protein